MSHAGDEIIYKIRESLLFYPSQEMNTVKQLLKWEFFAMLPLTYWWKRRLSVYPSFHHRHHLHHRRWLELERPLPWIYPASYREELIWFFADQGLIQCHSHYRCLLQHSIDFLQINNAISLFNYTHTTTTMFIILLPVNVYQHLN